VLNKNVFKWILQSSLFSAAFGPAFDEIVVESHLTVRRKNNARQGRTQNVTNEAGIVKTKREIQLPVYSPQT
jgi:hypothetical protein